MKVSVSNDTDDFIGFVDDDTNFDDTFDLIEEESGDRYRINGWQISYLEVLD